MAYFDETSKVWYGPKVDFSEFKAVTFREHLLKSFRLKPDKVFQISDDEKTQLTYRETELLSFKIAQNLKKSGILKNDVVCLLMSNSTYVTPITFGCVLSGISISPLSYGLTIEEIKHRLNIAKPKAIILEESVDLTEKITQVIEEIGIDCKIFTVETDKKFNNPNIFPFRNLLNEIEDDKKFEISSDDGVTDETIVFIIFSSGSTGISKAISINGHYCKHLKNILCNNEDLVVFTYSQISWISGVMTLFIAVLNNGLRITSKENFTVKHFANMVQKYGVTFTISSVQLSSTLMTSPDFNREDFISMKHYICGGERIPCNLREFLKSRFNPGSFGVAYGSTESGFVTRFNRGTDTSGIKDNIVGNLIENVTCKIVDAASEKHLGPNQVGRVFVKTETMLSGYYGNEKLTAKCLDSDGWYDMGDVGYFDDKETLYIHGRSKDIIFVNGRMLHLAELENVFESIEGIKDACVVEIIPNEGVLAVLVTKLPNSLITEEILEKIAIEKFKDIKFDGGIHIVDEIPRTLTVASKVVKNEAKEFVLKLAHKKN